MNHRRGTILIIVAGLAAILLVMVVGLLSRSRVEARSSAQVVQESQARLMLHAACQYVLEGSRLGYDSVPVPAGHPQRDPAVADQIIAREAFGWVDVRGPLADPITGAVDAIGPKDQFGYRLYDPTPVDPMDPASYLRRWPAPGAVARCPLYRKVRPPFAVSGSELVNPVPFRPGGAGDRSYVTWGDFPNAWPAALTDRWASYEAGDPAAVPESLGLSWFRVYREVEEDHNGVDDPGYPYDDAPGSDPVDLSGHHGVFVVTCGAGATEGFRDWAEVVSAGAAIQFGNEQAFLALQESERRLWYRIEYNAAIGADDSTYSIHDGYIRAHGDGHDLSVHNWDDQWRLRFDRDPTVNPVTFGTGSSPYVKTNRRNFNPLGTILWIQRLDEEPARW